MTLAELITATSQVGLSIALGADRKSLSVDKPKGTLSERQQELLDEVLRRREELVRYLRGDPPEPKDFVLPRLTCAELDGQDFQLTYAIEGTLVEGQPAMFAGGHKTLKTSLLVDMAVSLATGGFFLGKLKVTRPYRVAMLSGESGMATIQETARRICVAAGAHLPILDIVWSPALPRMDNPIHRFELTRWLQADEREIVIIDPAYLCMPSKDANNLMAQGELLRAMADACQEAGAMPILCHHTKRGVVNPYAPPELADIAWSGFAEFARQWLLVGRRERYEPGTGEHKLWLNVGGSAGHSALWALDIDEGTASSFEGRRWDIEVSLPDEARQQADEQQRQQREAKKSAKKEAELEENLQKLVELLAKGGDTKSSLRDRGGWNTGQLRAVIAEALAREIIIECQVDKNERQYEGYKLNPEGLKECA